jgi:hypothetical protein
MGASGWAYWVPYRPDIRQALHNLRQEVFQRGGYYQPAQFFSMILDSQIGQDLPSEARDGLEARIDAWRALPAPASIAEVLERMDH